MTSRKFLRDSTTFSHNKYILQTNYKRFIVFENFNCKIYVYFHFRYLPYALLVVCIKIYAVTLLLSSPIAERDFKEHYEISNSIREINSTVKQNIIPEKYRDIPWKQEEKKQ